MSSLLLYHAHRLACEAIRGWVLCCMDPASCMRARSLCISPLHEAPLSCAHLCSGFTDSHSPVLCAQAVSHLGGNLAAAVLRCKRHLSLTLSHTQHHVASLVAKLCLSREVIRQQNCALCSDGVSHSASTRVAQVPLHITPSGISMLAALPPSPAATSGHVQPGPTPFDRNLRPVNLSRTAALDRPESRRLAIVYSCTSTSI